MDIKILEDKKNSITFEIQGASHGFCALLKEELAKDKAVKLATYRVDHPLIGIPRMKVDGDDPRASIKKAVKKLMKDVEEFKEQVKKIR